MLHTKIRHRIRPRTERPHFVRPGCICATCAFLAQILLVDGGRTPAEDTPSAVALLRGVELARCAHDSVKAEIEVTFASLPSIKTVDCLVELRGVQRRFEVFGDPDTAQVVIKDGDECRSFRRKPHEDLQIYDFKEAVAIRGDLAFDPRVLGLHDFMPCNAKVRDCLWYDRNDSLSVQGGEAIDGLNVWRVRATRQDAVAEYWIEEPSFRVHRRRLETPYHTIEIRSAFDTNIPAPFPRVVTATREFKERAPVGSPRPSAMKWVYKIKSFDAGAEITAVRFTTRSIDLPVNTAAVDYRIHRIIGYWDGEGLSEQPVYQGETPVAAREPRSEWIGRLLLIAVNAVVLLALVVFVLLRKHKTTRV